MNGHTEPNPVGAGIAGAIYGGICGALIGSSVGGTLAILAGAALAGLYMGAAEAYADVARQPGALKPLAHRVIGLTLLGAALGALLSPLGPVALGLALGTLFGLFGLGPRKLALGIGVGLGLGLIAAAAAPNGALLGGAIALLFRLLLVALFRDTEPIQVMAERVPPEHARYVVPYEAHTRQIGPQFMESLALETAGAFTRNPPDVGIVESLDALRGPTFDPDRVDPLIREFYEHTTRFRLAIAPDWNPVARPFFWVFKSFIAQRIGQANLPFNATEAQRGIVSYVDTIDYADCDDIRTLRGWVRAFEATGETIYVGVYTVARHDGAGYVSVGFPLPEANFTATLLPYNHQHSDFLLRTRTGSPFTGHYLSDINNDTGALTVIKLPTMDEEIAVYVENGQLRTDHRFYLGGVVFLTLRYTIERKTGG